MYDPFAPEYEDAIAPRQGFWSAVVAGTEMGPSFRPGGQIERAKRGLEILNQLLTPEAESDVLMSRLLRVFHGGTPRLVGVLQRWRTAA